MIGLGIGMPLVAQAAPRNTHLRGMAQGMRATLQFGGAGLKASLTHSAHYSPVQGFGRSQVVFATTYPAGTQLQDTDLPDALFFQCALEPVFFAGRSGIPARQYQYKWGGLKTGSYNGPGTNPRRYIRSDWLYHPYIPPGSLNKFGLWTFQERQTGTGGIASSDIGSTFIERGEGFQTFTTSQIAGDPTLNAASIGAMSATQIGASTSLTPAFLIIDYGTDIKVVSLSGDSIGQFVGEGYDGSGALGDTLGSALRNCGYAQRGIVETLGMSPALNISKASDGTKFSAAAGAMAGRLALLRLANPTHHFMQEGVNDMAGTGLAGNPVAWAASTFYGYGEVRTLGGNAYIVTRGGISASSGGPSGTGSAITDGQVVWRYLGASGPLDRHFTIYSRQSQVALAYRTSVPGLIICKAFSTPVSQSTDNFATIANQTASYPGTGTPRGGKFALYLADRAAGNATIGDTWFEPGAATTAGGVKIEDGYDGTVAGLSCKWGANGSSWLFTNADGTHPNSFGCKTIGDSFTAALFP